MKNFDDNLPSGAVDSLRGVCDLLDSDPEYAKTLGINAQGIAYLHGTAGVLSKFTND